MFLILRICLRILGFKNVYEIAFEASQVSGDGSTHNCVNLTRRIAIYLTNRSSNCDHENVENSSEPFRDLKENLEELNEDNLWEHL